jgi:two-component system chemotaxis response regulator CheB/chemosensory pili system protein ChpB (putative protein-glutamate methylesterase)
VNVSSLSGVAVALLYDSVARCEHLRETLTALGTPIVYEAAASALDRDALARSQASVVIVNLADEDSPDLDEVYALFDDARYKVVFNDSGVSSNLSGWDHARWVRHLSAKVLGDADIDPPRPADAQAVPVRKRAEPAVAPTPAPAPQAPVAIEPAAAVEPPAAVEPAPAVESFASETSVRSIEASSVPLDFDPTEFIDLLQDVESAGSIPAAQEKSAPRIDLDEQAEESIELSGIDDLLADFDATAPLESMEPQFGDDEFVVELSPEEIPTAIGMRPAEEAPPEFDLGLDFDLDLDDVAQAQSAPTPAAPVGFSGGAASSWSLEDFDDAPAPPPTGPATFGIEKVSAAEFLTPEGGDEAAQPPMPSLSELALELIPLEEAVSPTRERPDHEVWLDPDAIPKAKIRSVWVLGASVGGPESVREFLGELPRDYPALFLLAQHLGDEFVDMMAKQLSRATALTVRTPQHGERVAHGDIIIVPNGHRLQVDIMGVVLLERLTTEPAYRPSIDHVLEDIADRFGESAGAIIFSGMSDDAVAGSRRIAEKGGKVYAQTPESCVVSTMVEGVNDAGIVSFLGTPKELAEKLLAERT